MHLRAVPHGLHERCATAVSRRALVLRRQSVLRSHHSLICEAQTAPRNVCTLQICGSVDALAIQLCILRRWLHVQMIVYVRVFLDTFTA